MIRPNAAKVSGESSSLHNARKRQRRTIRQRPLSDVRMKTPPVSYQHPIQAAERNSRPHQFLLLTEALSCTLAPARSTCQWDADDHKWRFTPNLKSRQPSPPGYAKRYAVSRSVADFGGRRVLCWVLSPVLLCGLGVLCGKVSRFKVGHDAFVSSCLGHNAGFPFACHFVVTDSTTDLH